MHSTGPSLPRMELRVDNEYWPIGTEPYGPEGVVGAWLTFMVLVPAGSLALAWWQDRHAQSGPAAA